MKYTTALIAVIGLASAAPTTNQLRSGSRSIARRSDTHSFDAPSFNYVRKRSSGGETSNGGGSSNGGGGGGGSNRDSTGTDSTKVGSETGYTTAVEPSEPSDPSEWETASGHSDTGASESSGSVYSTNSAGEWVPPDRQQLLNNVNRLNEETRQQEERDRAESDERARNGPGANGGGGQSSASGSGGQ